MQTRRRNLILLILFIHDASRYQIIWKHLSYYMHTLESTLNIPYKGLKPTLLALIFLMSCRDS